MDRPEADDPTDHVIERIDRVDSNRRLLRFARGAANLRLATTTEPDVLLIAAGPPRGVHVTATTGLVVVRSPRRLPGSRRLSVSLHVNEAAFSAMQFDRGATNIDLDLRSAALESVRFRSGAFRVRIAVPPSNPVEIEFMSSADRVTLVRPIGAAVRLHFDRGAADVDIEGTLQHASYDSYLVAGRLHAQTTHKVAFHRSASRIAVSTTGTS